MKEYLKNLLSSSGDVSFMRVTSLLVLADIMTIWTITCIKRMEITDIPWGVVCVITIMVTGKAIQKFAEGKNENGN